MAQCEYFDRCGNSEAYKCNNSGALPSGQPAECYNLLSIPYDREELIRELETVVVTIDNDIEALKKATRVTHEVLNIEFGALCC